VRRLPRTPWGSRRACRRSPARWQVRDGQQSCRCSASAAATAGAGRCSGTALLVVVGGVPVWHIQIYVIQLSWRQWACSCGWCKRRCLSADMHTHGRRIWEAQQASVGAASPVAFLCLITS
jgi:hypothetical protein